MANYQEEKNTEHGVAEPALEYGIPAAVSGIWHAIQTLSPSNRQWIRDRLIEQDEDERIDLISEKELAACFSIEEAEKQLLQMVHEHFSKKNAI